MLIYSLAQAEVIVPALRKPSRGLGMLLGGSAKRKLDSDRRVCSVQQYGNNNCILISLSICFLLNIIHILNIKTILQAVIICLHFNSTSTFLCDYQDQDEMKLEQIKSSLNLRFQTFSERSEQLHQAVQEPAQPLESSDQKEAVDVPVTTSNLEDIIVLDDDDDDMEEPGNEESEAPKSSHHEEEPVAEPVTTHCEDVIILDDEEDDDNAEEPVKGDSEAANVQPLQTGNGDSASSANIEEGDGSVSLSDLSSSFQKCFQSINESRKATLAEKSKAQEVNLQVQPFDYEEARKQVDFGQDAVGRKADKTNKTKTVPGDPLNKEVTNEFQQGKRRQAFPATGNRSYTFR